MSRELTALDAGVEPFIQHTNIEILVHSITN